MTPHTDVKCKLFYGKSSQCTWYENRKRKGIIFPPLHWLLLLLFLDFFYVKFPLGQSERGKHKIIFIVNYKERRRRTESDISIFLWHFVSIIRLKVISPIFRAGFFIFCVAFVIHMDMLYAPMTFYRCVVRCKVNDLNYFYLL